MKHEIELTVKNIAGRGGKRFTVDWEESTFELMDIMQEAAEKAAEYRAFKREHPEPFDLKFYYDIKCPTCGAFLEPSDLSSAGYTCLQGHSFMEVLEYQ